MRVRLVEDKTQIYPEPVLGSSNVVELIRGDEIEIGASQKRDNKYWTEATLLDGRRGFIRGGTRYLEAFKVKMRQDLVKSYESPSRDSAIKITYKKGDHFYICKEWKPGDEWVKIEDFSGNVGFVHGETKVRGGPSGFNCSSNDVLSRIAHEQHYDWETVLNNVNNNDVNNKPKTEMGSLIGFWVVLVIIFFILKIFLSGILAYTIAAGVAGAVIGFIVGKPKKAVFEAVLAVVVAALALSIWDYRMFVAPSEQELRALSFWDSFWAVTFRGGIAAGLTGALTGAIAEKHSV